MSVYSRNSGKLAICDAVTSSRMNIVSESSKPLKEVSSISVPELMIPIFRIEFQPPRDYELSE